MNLSRRTWVAVSAAALSGGLVAGMAGTALAYDDLDCADFSYQEDAQAILVAGPAEPHRLDDGADGVACKSLPNRQSESSVAGPEATAATAPETTPQIVPAQAVTRRRSGSPPGPSPHVGTATELRVT